jgi:DNA polymerase-1
MAETPAVSVPRPEETKNYRTVTTHEELSTLAHRLGEAGRFAFDMVTGAGNPMNAQLVGISVSPVPGEAYYIPLTHAGLEAGPQLAEDEVKHALSPAFESLKVEKSAHNANFATSLLHEYGIDSRRVLFDTMLAAHLLGEQSLELNSPPSQLAREQSRFRSLVCRFWS